MSMISCDTARVACVAPVAAVDMVPCRALHRLREVREQQQVSLRSAARRLGISLAEAEHQEDPATDLPLETLYRWQEVLDVPISVLLVDDDLKLSSPIYERARMLRLMKTAATLQQASQSKRTESLIQMLIEQLLEIMPELRDVGPWLSSGSQRGFDDLGRVAERRMSDEILLQN